MAGEAEELCRVTPPAWSPFRCWYPGRHMAVLQNQLNKGIFCSRQHTEGLQVGVGWTERNALRSGVEMLPCGRGTCRRDMALQHWHPALSLPCQCVSALPQTAAQLDLVSLLFSKQIQTTLSAASAWGAPRQAGVILPWTQHAASPELAGCSRVLLPCSPCSAWAAAPSYIPVEGEASPLSL